MGVQAQDCDSFEVFGCLLKQILYIKRVAHRAGDIG